MIKHCPMLACASLLFLSCMAVAAQPSDCTQVQYAKLRPPRYPEEAVKAQVQGTVIVNALISEKGIPGDLKIERSSGYSMLDDAAIESVAEWRFVPASCKGKVVAARTLVPVQFDLHDYERDAQLAAGPTWKLVEDKASMEFPTLRKELAYLDSRHDLRAHDMAIGKMLDDPRTFVLWLVIENQGPGSSLVAHDRKAVFRFTATWEGDSPQGRYAFLCESKNDQCARWQQQLVQIFTDNPPPPPPKASLPPP